jgi:hypothetical protein
MSLCDLRHLWGRQVNGACQVAARARAEFWYVGRSTTDSVDFASWYIFQRPDFGLLVLRTGFLHRLPSTNESNGATSCLCRSYTRHERHQYEWDRTCNTTNAAITVGKWTNMDGGGCNGDPLYGSPVLPCSGEVELSRRQIRRARQ